MSFFAAVEIPHKKALQLPQAGTGTPKQKLEGVDDKSFRRQYIMAAVTPDRVRKNTTQPAMTTDAQRDRVGPAWRETPGRHISFAYLPSLAIVIKHLGDFWLFVHLCCSAFVSAREHCPPTSGKSGVSSSGGPAAFSSGKTCEQKKQQQNFTTGGTRESGEEQAEKRKENSRSRIIYLL